MHVVFLPDRRAARFFLWGDGAASDPLGAGGRRERLPLVDEGLALRGVAGVSVALLDALPRLAASRSAELERASASTAVWSQAAKLALDLVGRERLVPRIVSGEDGDRARFTVSLALREDAERVAALARAFPLAAHAVPLAVPPEEGPRRRARPARRGKVAPKRRRVPAGRVWTAQALLATFLDAAADALVRAACRGRTPAPERANGRWERRFVEALLGPQAIFVSEGFAERGTRAELEDWCRPALGAELGEPRTCFRLDVPPERPSERATRGRGRETARDAFPLQVFLQAADDPSLLVPSAEVFGGRGRALQRLGCASGSAEELLLRSLAAAARLFPPLERALREARPEGVLLAPHEAWSFLTHGASALSEAGLGVILPADLTRSGKRRLRLRLRVAMPRRAADSGASVFSLDEALSFRWEAALGDDALSARELAELAALKAPLVRWRGRWVAVDRAELEEVGRLVGAGGGTIPGRAALTALLGGSASRPDTTLPIEIAAEGALERLLARLCEKRAEPVPVPRDFHGTLRPYQERGLAWLVQMDELGLGACLADDMGLGKTIQLLAYLLARRRSHAQDRRPALLVCPTSVVGNWEREIARFAPALRVVRHYGPERARAAEELCSGHDGKLVITTYGLLRRDAELLSALDWAVVALDEAQNVKNAASLGAGVARSLRASFRVALTGTPVENRLSELWSLSEFLNPRLLGPLEAFRREFAVPIERHGRDDVAERLSRIVRPFLLRRLKSDPAIVRDLPEKLEMKVVCTLTREQASLYQATLDEHLRVIEEADGIRRRGLVLALLTALKQICNHPAHFLGEAGPLERRSGKLTRMVEMLEELLDAGDRALVFTQYREMGERLVAALARALGSEPLFLHGGVPRAKRESMIRSFQDDPRGPRVFVLSLKAGGTGLNLTAASHVFHFDRWWNPAVEDQATDRAHRIGQVRRVQVHKLLCAGTLEEKIDRMLDEKRGLAERIVGRGEQWITELGDDELRELFALAPGAVVAEDGDVRGDGESISTSRARTPAMQKSRRARRSARTEARP